MFRRRTETPAAPLSVDVVDDLLVVRGGDLDRVLAEVGDRLGPDAEVLDAERSIVGGVAGFFGREQFTVHARTGSLHVADAGDEPLDGRTFAAALATALAEVDDLVAARQDELFADPDPQPPTAPVPEPHAPEPDPAREPDEAREEISWDGAAMLELRAPDLTDEQLTSRLGELVGTPPMLPRRGIVAVVGDPDESLATAEELARRAGLDPDDVLVASPVPGQRAAWLTVDEPADAARRRDRWTARIRPTVISVTLTPGLEGLQWARTMLDALDADQVRLAVPGWRHAEDVVPRLRGLARVHAIDLCDPVDATAASGFLGLTIPVGTLAGRPATVEAWFHQLRPASSEHAPTRSAAPTAVDPRKESRT